MTKNRASKLAARDLAATTGQSYTAARWAGRGPAPATGLWRGGAGHVPTGMTALDRLLGGGLPSGEITALWGATGAGTSMLGLTFARMAARNAQRALVVCAEDSMWVYRDRLLAAVTGLPYAQITSGSADPWLVDRAENADWMRFLRLYSCDDAPVGAGDLAADLLGVPENLGWWPALIVVDDLGALDDDPDVAVPGLARIARELHAAVVVIQASPPVLCRAEPAVFTDEQLDGVDMGLTWPERVPGDDELAADPRTRALWRASAAALTLTTPGDPPVFGAEITDLTLTVHARGASDPGTVAVRRDGPRARFLPGVTPA